LLAGIASEAITRREEVERQNRLDYFGDQLAAFNYFMRLPLIATFGEVNRKLQEMRTLVRDWNSYGAESPNETSLNRAAQTLTQLQDRLFVPTKIVPSSEGGVAICFIQGDRYADIEFLNTGENLAVTYSEAEEPNVWSIEDGMMELTIDRIQRHFIR
jgi:hypothetical protein